MVKIVHAADIHAGRPASRELSQEKASIRRREVEASLFRIVDLVKREKAQVLLVAGDFFEHTYVRPAWVREVSSLFASIPKTWVFISPGNHDPMVRDSLYRSTKWSQNVIVFDSPRFKEVVLKDLGIAIYGLGWNSFFERDRLLKGFKTSRSDLFSILLLHADFITKRKTSGQENAVSDYLPVWREDIENCGADYVALGHIHSPCDFNVGKSTVVYPGCPEPLDFGDQGERGIYVLVLGKASNRDLHLNQKPFKVEFVPLCARKMRAVELDITGLDTEEKVRNAILSLGDTESRMRDLWSVTLTGRVDPEIEFDIFFLERELSSEFFFIRLIPKYMPDYDLDLLTSPQDQSLEARFVKQLLDLKKKAENKQDQRAAKVAELAIYYGLDALRHGKVVFRRRDRRVED